MNKLYLALLLTLTLVQSAFSQIPNPEILYYKFNQTGTSATNYATAPPSGTTTATLMGGVTQGGSGQCDGALIGTGVASSTDYLNTGWATNLSGSWSISFWTSNITPSATLFYIFGDASAASFRCFTNGVAGPNNWIFRGGFTDVYINGGATVVPHMTTFVYDAVAGNIYGYLDGVLVTTVAQSPITISGTGPFKVMGYGTNVGSPSGGLMDEYRMYGHALTNTEITQLYTRRTTSTINVVSCGDYTVPSGDETYSIAGTYMDTIPNTVCGDSVMTINVTINQPSASSFTEISCGNYTAPSGALFTTSGIYMDTIPNAIGCDSVMTINLTVNQPSTSTIIETVCGNYTAPSGAILTTSGIYMDTIPNAIGCDSVMTINLTVNQPSTNSITEVSCDAYTSPSGATYSTSGTYMDVIPNAAGCDSVITIGLTILNSSNSSITEAACGNYTAPDGQVYTSSGMITATIPNAAGCDSTIAINLTVTNVNSGISLNGLGQLEATQSGATYQWINCSNGGLPIAGETSQTLGTSTIGTYAVEVTLNGCTETSACMANEVGMNELSGNEFTVYPNPVTSSLTIKTAVQEQTKYSVYNQAGQRVLQTNSNETVVVLDMSQLAPGVYQLKAETPNSIEVFRLVKQ